MDKGFYRKPRFLDIGLENEPIEVFCDNKATIALIKNGAISSKSKFIDVSYHYVRDVVEKGAIKVDFVPIENMLADPMTKGLSNEEFKCHIKNMGVNASMIEPSPLLKKEIFNYVRVCLTNLKGLTNTKCDCIFIKK